MKNNKIQGIWDQDAHDNNILVLEKEEGKLSREEVKEFLSHSHNGSFKGKYVLIIQAEEAQGGEETKGDQWELYKVEPGAGYAGTGSHFMKRKGKLIEK